MGAIAQRVAGRVHDLGSFEVRRLLPSLACRQVGPFVFLDHIGPARFAPGGGIDVRPHPHIGLATVTYLFEGAIGHRDSVGSVQVIRPGDVNWMTAGRGIVHSERTPDAERAAGHALHGLQFWVALPLQDEEMAPAFQHCPGSALPHWSSAGAELRLIAGAAYARRSPVQVRGDLFYVDLRLDPGAGIELPRDHAERAVLLISGQAEIDSEALPTGELVVLTEGAAATVRSMGGARLVAFGGAPLDAPRHLDWNFVSSSRERIQQARRDWREQRFDPVPGETEFIPLPER